MFLLLISLASTAGQSLPDCGFRNSRPCHPFDDEFYTQGLIVGCDRGLVVDIRNLWKTSDDICANATRVQIDKEYDWVRWAMAQQMLSISQNEPINWYTHITAHNSYNNQADVYPAPNQWYSMTSLLNFGIRSLDLDIHHVIGKLRVCHGSTGTEATGCSGGDRTYAYAIREIADWLDANPGEVVIINIEDDAPNDLDTMLTPLEKYIGSKLWRLSDSNKYLGGANRHPTVAEMLAHGKQALVLDDTTQVRDDIFHVDQNGLSSRQAKNFNQSACTSDSTSISIHPASEPLYWPTLYEGRSLFESKDDQNNLLDETDVRAAVNCGITSVDLDYIGNLAASIRFPRYSPDLRREATIWSWAEGDNGSNGNYALFNGASGRWASHANQDGNWAFACAEPRTGDPRTWSDPKGDRWYITDATGIWNDGAQACRDLGSHLNKTLEFSWPRNGYQSQKLWAAVGKNKSVWLGYTIKPVPAPALVPATMDIVVGEHEPSPDQILPLTIYGPENSTYAVTISTENHDPWLVANTYSGTLLKGKSTIQISTVSSLTSGYSLGDYAGRVQVTITLPVKPCTPGRSGFCVNEEIKQTNSLPVSLHVKLPSKTSLTFVKPSPTDTSLFFQADLTTDVNQEFRPTGTVELRSQVTDPATLQKSVVTLGSAIVNDFADNGQSLPDNEVKFQVTLPPGDNHLAAVYLGDSGYGPSVSNSMTIHARSMPKIVLSAAPSGGEAGKTFQLIANVTDPLDQHLVNTTVTFRYYQGAVLGSAPVVNGVASLTVGPLAPNYYTFQASSADTSDYFAAASNTIQYTVESPVNITLNSVPSGLIVLVDGAPVHTPATYQWVPFQTHVITTDGTYQQNGDYRYASPTWSRNDSTVTTQRTLAFTVPEGPATITGVFATQVLLRASAGPGGSVQVDNNLQNNWFYLGDTVIVEAIPDAGSAFKDFTGDVSGVNNPLVFKISKPASVTAEFVHGVNITISTNYPGLLFNLGGSHNTPFTFLQIPGETFTVFVNPNQDSGDTRNRFQQWSTGATTSSLSYVVPNASAPINLVAQFGRDHLLRTDIAGQGTIVTLPAPTDSYFLDGSKVQVTAVPKPGYVFTRWENALTGSSPSASFVMTGPKTLRAVFDPAPTLAGAESVLAASVIAKSGDPKLRNWTVQFQQVSGVPAMATQITSVALDPVSGSCTAPPKLLNSLPVAVGPFTGGKATGGLAIDFSGCPAATRFTVTLRYGADGSGIAKISNQFQ